MQTNFLDRAEYLVATPLSIDTYRKLRIRERAEAVTRSRHQRAIQMFCDAMGYESLTFPAGCIHNAYCDRHSRTGWLKGATEEQVATVRRAYCLLNDWSASRLAESLYAKAMRNN